VTIAEHLRLPTIKDMKEGIVAARIAAHAADIANGIPGARAALNWERMFQLSIDPAKSTEYRQSSPPEHEDSCTMCAKMYTVRNMSLVKERKDIKLN